MLLITDTLLTAYRLPLTAYRLPLTFSNPGPVLPSTAALVQGQALCVRSADVKKKTVELHYNFEKYNNYDISEGALCRRFTGSFIRGKPIVFLRLIP